MQRFITRSSVTLSTVLIAALALTACDEPGETAPSGEAMEQTLHVGLPTAGTDGLTWHLRAADHERVLRLSTAEGVDRLSLSDGDDTPLLAATFDPEVGVDVDVPGLLTASSAAAPFALAVDGWPEEAQLDALLVEVALSGGLPVPDDTDSRWVDRFNFLRVAGEDAPPPVEPTRPVGTGISSATHELSNCVTRCKRVLPICMTICSDYPRL